MADLGKVVITDVGNYSANVTYEKLTFVHHQGDAYMTLKTVKGVTPTDDGINYRLFCKSAELATASKAGIVLPDGTTTSVDSSGKISAKKATTSAAGIVKPASTDFTVASDGTQKIKTSFTQATALANIVANEAWLTMLGKISKAIESLMDLSTKALMKAAMSGIDANDSNKVPTSAFVHTLVERIGMGADLGYGFANLTAGLNSVKKGLDDTNSNFDSIFKAATVVDTCNDVSCGLYSYLNFTDNKKGSPENKDRGLLVCVSDSNWSNTGAIMYQLFLSWDNTLYTRCWVNGQSYGSWNKCMGEIIP